MGEGIISVQKRQFTSFIVSPHRVSCTLKTCTSHKTRYCIQAKMVSHRDHSWAPSPSEENDFSVTFLGLAGDIHKPDKYRRTQGFAELHLGMWRKYMIGNITASQP